MHKSIFAVAALLVAPLAFLAPSASADVSTFETEVESFDGHLVPVTVYRANNTADAPTLLWGHGWAGSRADSVGYGNFFAANGFNVVAMDFRGFGTAGGEARVHDVDFEIKDTIAVIDWIAEQDWAQLDAEGDPTLGALGGSYGGGYQLLTAAFDDRLDAIAPEITWNELPQSLAPNGGIKSAWVDLLYWGGNARGTLAPFIHQAYFYAMATNDFPRGQAPGVPDIVAQFERSSPASYDIDTPAFFIQGTPDTLFNLNQALANARQLEAAGAEVKLLTHLGGHILSTRGIIPVPLPDTGLQPGSAPSPCGDVRSQILAWYNATLLDMPDTLPRVQLALDDGTCVTRSTLEFATLDARSTDVLVPLAPGLAVSANARALGNRLDTSTSGLQFGQFAASTVVAGVPRFQATVEVLGAETIFYLGLLKDIDDGTRPRVYQPILLGSQVTPVRLVGAGTHVIDVELGGIATRFGPGEDIVVMMSMTDPQFAHNGERAPSAVILSAETLLIPVAT